MSQYSNRDPNCFRQCHKRGIPPAEEQRDDLDNDRVDGPFQDPYQSSETNELSRELTSKPVLDASGDLNKNNPFASGSQSVCELPTGQTPKPECFKQE